MKSGNKCRRKSWKATTLKSSLHIGTDTIFPLIENTLLNNIININLKFFLCKSNRPTLISNRCASYPYGLVGWWVMIKNVLSSYFRNLHITPKDVKILNMLQILSIVVHTKWGSLGQVPHCPHRKKKLKECAKIVNIGHRELVNTGSRKFHHGSFVISILRVS